ncbi:synaptotagmin-10-like [Gigantopelta aegis]|uniref:synaptotagmin-10-like n=1 Tax=Gigantopelta aegis TaxID=1735272 RepID=UPI001B88B58C|nr:synaptotagmin-10-like [Gigantopelta aegis]
MGKMHKDSLHPVIIGSIAGVASLFLVLVLAAGWFICRKKKRVLFDDADPIAFTDDSKMDRVIPISQSTPELGVEPEEVNTESSPVRRGLFQLSSRQWTLPSVPQRHQTFQRMLSHRLDLSNIEFSIKSFKHKEQPELGSIKPELYKQASVDSLRSEHVPCGKLFFSLKYVQEEGSLHVFIIRAEDLPAKDFSGTSDPYVKVYLLPDRKTKHQTKVHRKTLNPDFNELFVFTVQYEHLASRTLQFSLYDFDRFSRHDLIGAVMVKDILGEGSLMKETYFVREIYVIQQEKADIGDVMLSLCYLPTAGRLTLTIVKARNLKAMDITGSSDPYVKVSLMCQGKRIKKKKTSVKKSTLHPVFNEALVFDVPQESIEDVYLLVKLVDYDRIGSDELMGCCALGPKYNGLGRNHWYEMLENTRKPVAQWYQLQEHLPHPMPITPNGKCCLRQRQSTEDSLDGNSSGI